jgi:MFS family permease
MDRPLFGFAGILVANLVAALDAASLSVALPTIASELQTTSIEAYWAGTAFVLSSAACQPLFPAFSNALGRRPVVIFALSLLIIGTIVCGSAHNVSALLAGRTIQGVGTLWSLDAFVMFANLCSSRRLAEAESSQ